MINTNTSAKGLYSMDINGEENPVSGLDFISLVTMVDSLRAIPVAERSLSTIVRPVGETALAFTTELDRLITLACVDLDYYVSHVGSAVDALAKLVSRNRENAILYIELIAFVERDRGSDYRRLIIKKAVKELMVDIHRKIGNPTKFTSFCYDTSKSAYITANIPGKREFEVVLNSFGNSTDKGLDALLEGIKKNLTPRESKSFDPTVFTEKAKSYSVYTMMTYDSMPLLNTRWSRMIYELNVPTRLPIPIMRVKSVREYLKTGVADSLIIENIHRCLPPEAVLVYLKNAGFVDHLVFIETIDYLRRPCVLVRVGVASGEYCVMYFYKELDLHGRLKMSELDSFDILTKAEIESIKEFVIEMYADILVGVDKSRKRIYSIKFIEDDTDLDDSSLNSTNVYAKVFSNPSAPEFRRGCAGLRSTLGEYEICEENGTSLVYSNMTRNWESEDEWLRLKRL